MTKLKVPFGALAIFGAIWFCFSRDETATRAPSSVMIVDAVVKPPNSVESMHPAGVDKPGASRSVAEGWLQDNQDQDLEKMSVQELEAFVMRPGLAESRSPRDLRERAALQKADALLVLWARDPQRAEAMTHFPDSQTEAVYQNVKEFIEQTLKESQAIQESGRL